MTYSYFCVKKIFSPLLLIVGSLLLPLCAQATVITLINTDPVGSGFNDPTPFTPVGGNSATTLGQARLNALQEAVRLMEGVIDSKVEIRVDASMSSALNGPLGVGRTMALHHNFLHAPLPQIYYPGALADMLSGSDLDPDASDIKIQFDPSESFTSFYYGLDGNVPAADNDFISVAMHELTHGLGFSSSIDDVTGAISGFANAFDMLLEQHGNTPAMLTDMTDSQRLVAITSGPSLHWVGSNVVAVYGQHLPMFAPQPVQSGSSVSHFADINQGMMYHTASRGKNNRQPGLAAQVLHDMGWAIKHQGTVNHPPIFLGMPNVFGGMTEGNVLKVQAAETSDPDGDSVALGYQWQADGVDVIGAVGVTYTLQATDIAKTVSCIVTASDSLGGSVSVTASQTLVVPSATVVAGVSATYNIYAAVGASQQQWEVNDVRYAPPMEDAESGSGAWTTDSYGGYSVVVSDVVGVGSYSFHLARPNGTAAEMFTLNRQFVAMPNASVRFQSRLGTATVNQTIRLQLSEDGGVHWVNLWSQSGTDSAGSALTNGETSFQPHTVSLAQFVGKHIRLRFNYDYMGVGLFYNGISTGTGFYVDNIAFVNAAELLNSRVSAVSGLGVQTVTVPTMLRARSANSAGVWGAWGADVVVLGPAKWIDLTGLQTSVAATASVASGVAVNFQGKSFVGANRFQWEIVDLISNPLPETAEDGGVQWLDGTESSYPMVTTEFSVSANHSFHLAQPVANAIETVTLQRRLQVSPYSAVEFQSALVSATIGQYARLQVSDDGGVNWVTVWSVNGPITNRNAVFSKNVISLASYASKRVRLRFTYSVMAGNNYFPQITAAGFYFDDFTLINMSEEVNRRVTQQLAVDHYAVAVTTNGVSLRMRASFFPNLWSDWGVPLNAWVGDSDGDGVPDSQDAFPFDPTRWKAVAFPSLPAIVPPSVVTLFSVDGYALPASLPKIQTFLSTAVFAASPTTLATISPYNAPDWFSVGSTMVQFRAVDSYGTTVSASATITVVDQYADSDGDGLPDGWERHYFNTLNASDGSQDSDGDQLIDREEFRLGSDPTVTDAITRVWLLQPGWNLVGMSLTPTADALASLMTQATAVDSVWAYHHGWQSFTRSVPFSVNSLHQLQAGEGYWIHLLGQNSQSVSLLGVAAPPVKRIASDQQWHLLAAPVAQLLASDWSLASGSSEIWGFSAGQWQSYIAGTPYFLNSLTTLDMASGYYLQAPAVTVVHSLLGVTDPYQGWNMQRVNALAQWAGRPAVLNIFTDWYASSADGLFSTQLSNIWQSGMVPLVSWEPFTTPGQAAADIEVQIAQGALDHYIVGWATRLKQWLAGMDGVLHTADDRKIWLRPAHEMNGNWYPWSGAVGNNRAADYIAAWHHLHTLFAQIGLDNSLVQWVWSVNNVDVGGIAMEAYYPGDPYTDWVAMDGYNWGASAVGFAWQTPDQVFAPMLQRLRALTQRPVAITEVASTTVFTGGVTSLTDKSAWIVQLGQFATNNAIPMVVWFNEDKETDWAVFGGVNGDVRVGSYNAWAAWQTLVRDRLWVPPMAVGAQRISAGLFFGK